MWRDIAIESEQKGMFWHATDAGPNSTLSKTAIFRDQSPIGHQKNEKNWQGGGNYEKESPRIEQSMETATRRKAPTKLWTWGKSTQEKMSRQSAKTTEDTGIGNLETERTIKRNKGEMNFGINSMTQEYEAWGKTKRQFRRNMTDKITEPGT